MNFWLTYIPKVNTEDVEDARDINGNRIEDSSPSPIEGQIALLSRQNSFRQQIPNSPPPSFHSVIQADSELHESFSPSDDEEEDMRDLRRAPTNTDATQQESAPLAPAPSTSRLGSFFSVPAVFLGRSNTPSGARRVIGNGNDGVFANISAKPQVEEEEQLPVTILLRMGFNRSSD